MTDKEQIEMTIRVIEIIFVFAGLILVIFGWIVPYKQSLAKEKNNEIIM